MKCAEFCWATVVKSYFLKQNKTLIAVLLFNAVNWSSCLQHYFNNTDITTMCFIKEALDEFLIDFYEMIVK